MVIRRILSGTAGGYGGAGTGALGRENATATVKAIDDSFDDNPSERRRTLANRRFEKTA
jgi:hypothetical protein